MIDINLGNYKDFKYGNVYFFEDSIIYYGIVDDIELYKENYPFRYEFQVSLYGKNGKECFIVDNDNVFLTIRDVFNYLRKNIVGR